MKKKTGYKHSTKAVPFMAKVTDEWKRGSDSTYLTDGSCCSTAGGVVTFIPTLVGEVLNETHSFCRLHCVLYVRLFI